MIQSRYLPSDAVSSAVWSLMKEGGQFCLFLAILVTHNYREKCGIPTQHSLKKYVSFLDIGICYGVH